MMLLMDEKYELLTMATNHMKNDMAHPNHFVAGLSLCALGNISSASMARDLAPEVERLLASSNPYLRKKAALCAIRVLRKCPDLMENFVPRIRSLLSERNHGVLITGTSLMIELCEADPNNVEFFRRLAPTLVRILKNLVMSGIAPEYDVSGITDPFLQVKILHLLRLLGKGDQESSDVCNDILAQVATNTDHSRNVGNSILYEAVQTIMSIESEKDLRLLAVNVLGGFLSNRDNNIRYVALNSLTRVVSADAEAVQRHRNTIVDCLKDPDVSIRRRALDLIYALVNEANIKVLAAELLTFLQNSTVEFKADLATKLCSVTERFAPNKRWHVDTILKIMGIAGAYVPDEVASNLITLVAANADVQSYAVQKVYMALTNDNESQILVRVAVWCIGEFGDLLIQGGGEEGLNVTENDVIDLLVRVAKSPSSTDLTKEYLVTALMKLTTRFSSANTARLEQLITQYQNNMEVELQQRSCEYGQLFKINNTSVSNKTLLGRIPVTEVKEQAAREVHVKSAEGGPSLIKWDDLMGDSPQPAAPAVNPTPSRSNAPPAAAPLDPMAELFGFAPVATAPSVSKGDALKDLLGLDLMGGPAPTTPVTPVTPVMGNPMGGLDSLMGLGGGDIMSPAPIISTPTPTMPTAPLNGPLPAFTVYSKGGLTVTFEVVKNAQYPNITLINATFSNVQQAPLTEFDFKAAVPKYIKLQVNPPSSNVIGPNGGTVTQSFKLMNGNHGEKPLLLKVKMDYKINGAAASDVADVNFPPGV
eukprot:TRINITY_DN504_c0_g1_i1.p1 TRINITY_DN504_c0_g1~~TRINITY_DN504_c0_g1_i1.p1  ORF type:complete len:863 (+),score=300.63 TRINITY_DN504_c0_g1_i1:305-2590(+)